MASVHRQVGSKYWIAAFRLPNGKRTMRSTKETDKSKAIQVAMKFEDAARKQVTADQAQNVLADIVKIVSGDAFLQHDARRWIDGWVGRKKLELADASFKKYERVCRDFAKSLPPGIPLANVGQSIIANFRNEEAARTSADSANVALKILRTMFRDAHGDAKVIPENPAKDVRFLRKAKGEVKEGTRRPFQRAEVERLLKEVGEESEWYGAILLGLYTGQRLGDVARCSADDIKNQVWFFTSRKTRRLMEIPLASPLQGWLSKRGLKSGPVFPTLAAVKNVGTLSNQFYGLMVDAGLAQKRPHVKAKDGRDGKREKSELSFHSLRHTLTTLLKSVGVSESIAMEFVGHESAAVNRTYTHLPVSALIEAAGKLPDVTRS